MQMKLPSGETVKAKISGFVRKIGKRNLAIVLSVLLIGGAVWMNWRLFSDAGGKGETVYSGNAEAGAEETGDPTDVGVQNGEGNYFTTTQINRQRNRDEALEVLQMIVTNEEAVQDSVNTAMAQIQQIAKDIENESDIETMVKAKGFEECVAVISDGHCSVIVKTEGLRPDQVAQLQEIVYEQTGILPVNIKLVEKQS